MFRSASAKCSADRAPSSANRFCSIDVPVRRGKDYLSLAQDDQTVEGLVTSSAHYSRPAVPA